MKLAEVQQILQLLLREQVPIRQLGPILETLGEYAARTKDPVLLGEFVRQRLARTISLRYRDKDKRLPWSRSIRRWRIEIIAGIEHAERGIVDSPAPAGRRIDLPSARARSRTAWPRRGAGRSCWSARRFAPQ